MAFRAAYLNLLDSRELAARADEAWDRLQACDLCAWRCGVNRLEGEAGQCRTGARAVVGSCQPHYGEERPLVGRHGSGTIFFSWCNLHCCFCQNADLSAAGAGHPVDADELAEMMLALQAISCHNINVVSPSHVVPQILAALVLAAQRGLRVPLVYNTGGYDALDTLRLLDGVADIYMPDMKYADAETGQQLSGPANYPAVNQAAVKEMHRQVGDLRMDDRGVAQRGLLVRHLVLPEELAGTEAICRFLAEEVSRDTYLNVMPQYRPCHEASRVPQLRRRPTPAEYEAALAAARAAGLHRLDER